MLRCLLAILIAAPLTWAIAGITQAIMALRWLSDRLADAHERVCAWYWSEGDG
jgi:hypothetical protein